MLDLYQNQCKDCMQFWFSDFKEENCFRCKSINISSEKVENVSIGNLIKGDET